MTPVTVSYPLDPTGVSPLNLVQGEIQILVANRKVYAIAPLYGSFFANSLEVVNSVTHQVYVRDIDFYAANLKDFPSSQYGQDVCDVVIVSNELLTAHGGNLSLKYQALGGIYGESAGSVVNVLNNLSFFDRTPEWEYPLSNPSLLPESSRLFSTPGDVFGFEYVVQALDRIARAIEHGDEVAHDAIYQYIDMNRDVVSYDVIERMRLTMLGLLLTHTRASDPHLQYMKRSDQVQVDAVRKPINVSPAAGTLNAGTDLTLTGKDYAALYRVAQQAAQFQLSVNPGCVAPFVFDQTTAGVGVDLHYPTALLNGTQYYWRVRYQNVDNIWSQWSDVSTFTTLVAGINAPVFTSPLNNDLNVGETPTLTASAFSTFGATDTHQGTDWEIWTGANGTGTLVFGTIADAVNKTTLSVPKAKLVQSTSYYLRVRYRGASGSISAYSPSVKITTAATFLPVVIGEAFGGGFYGGDITYNSHTYAIIVAPKVGGETSLALANTYGVLNGSDADSVLNTTNLKAISGGSPAANFAMALTIAGFTDWKVPSAGVLLVLSSNLRPGLVTAPAIYKAGGAQAFDANNWYWSSSPYQHVEDEGYYVDGAPIYQTQTTTTEQGRSLSSGPIGESADVSGSIKCGYGQAGPNNVSGPDFVTNGTQMPNGEYVGYYSASWSCTITTTTQVIIGYEQGTYYPNDVTYNDAKIWSFGSNYNTYVSKPSTYLMRAVRLIQRS